MIDDTEILHAGLSTRAANLLAGAGFKTVQDVLDYTPAWKLCRIPGFGHGCLKEIERLRRGELQKPIPSPQADEGQIPFTRLALDENDAATLMGLGVSTLQKMRMHGTGPKYAKIGRLVRYRPQDLQDFIDERVGA